MKKADLRKLGILLVIIGFFLVIYGLIGSNMPIHCPAGGCSASYLQEVSAPFIVSFYLGISLMILGVVLLIASRNAKVATTTNSH